MVGVSFQGFSYDGGKNKRASLSSKVMVEETVVWSSTVCGHGYFFILVLHGRGYLSSNNGDGKPSFKNLLWHPFPVGRWANGVCGLWYWIVPSIKGPDGHSIIHVVVMVICHVTVCKAVVRNVSPRLQHILNPMTSVHFVKEDLYRHDGLLLEENAKTALMHQGRSKFFVALKSGQRWIIWQRRHMTVPHTHRSKLNMYICT